MILRSQKGQLNRNIKIQNILHLLHNCHGAILYYLIDMCCISLASAIASRLSTVVLRRACQPNLVKYGSSLQVVTFNWLLRFNIGDSILCQKNTSVDTHWLNELAV